MTYQDCIQLGRRVQLDVHTCFGLVELPNQLDIPQDQGCRICLMQKMLHQSFDGCAEACTGYSI